VNEDGVEKGELRVRAVAGVEYPIKYSWFIGRKAAVFLRRNSMKLVHITNNLLI